MLQFVAKTLFYIDNLTKLFTIKAHYILFFRNLPETLQPLSSWLTNSISQEVIGVDPIKCLVFLPNMDYSSLPEVPEPHTCEDDLPYFRDVTTPKPWVNMTIPPLIFSSPEQCSVITFRPSMRPSVRPSVLTNRHLGGKRFEHFAS